jgi:DNA-binding transcriptional regulator YiaG
MEDLKQIRKNLNFTKKQIAELCRVCPRTWQAWEQNERAMPKMYQYLLLLKLELIDARHPYPVPDDKMIKSGKHLKQQRRIARLTSAQVAELCGVSPHTVRRWEAGQPVPLAARELLAYRLLRPGDYLTGVIRRGEQYRSQQRQRKRTVHRRNAV